MSGALSYLLLTKLKNKVKSIVKSPAKLVYTLIMLAMIGLVIFAGNKGAEESQGFRDMGELAAIVTGLYALIFALVAYGGFSRGGAIFSLSDVNLIFTSPAKQERVLFYGLFQQLGNALMLGLFIVFQYGWMRNVYGVRYGAVLLMLAGYAAAVFLGQFTAMVIYSFTSSDERRKKLVKTLFFAVIAAFSLYAAISVIGGPGAIGRLVAAVNGEVLSLFPVGGWLGRAVYGIMNGDARNILIGLSISTVYLICLIALIVKGHPDFYEDVLQSAEVTHSAITARREGQLAEAAPTNVKLGRTGLGKGFGADAFYYKHKIENRRSRVFVLSVASLIWAAGTIIFAFAMRSSGIAPIFVFSTYMQIFSVAMGRLNKELSKPYVYLVPEPPFNKLLQCLREMLPSATVEAVVIFVPVALIVKLGPVDTLLCVAARISFTMLFTAGNLLVERWMSGLSKAFTILLYMVTMFLLSAPGVVLAIILSPGFGVIGENAAILLSLIVCNIPVSLLVFYLCRNMLQYAELNNR